MTAEVTNLKVGDWVVLNHHHYKDPRPTRIKLLLPKKQGTPGVLAWLEEERAAYHTWNCSDLVKVPDPVSNSSARPDFAVGDLVAVNLRNSPTRYCRVVKAPYWVGNSHGIEYNSWFVLLSIDGQGGKHRYNCKFLTKEAHED